VKRVEVSLETGEAMVQFRRGALVEESLPQAVNATGQFAAALQAKEAWTLDLSPGTSDTAAEQARSGLMLLSGVTNAVLREGELEVTAYVPRVSTDMILKIVASSGCPASVRVETVALRVEGAISEEVLGRLSKVPGISRVEKEEEGDGPALRLTREMGRAGVTRLNRILEGTGCSVKAAG
jgi:hypothetical protein